ADITHARPESVASGRGMEEIARNAPRVWESGRKAEAPQERVKARFAAAKERAEASAKTTAATPAVDPSAIEGARKGALPGTLEPELATLVKDVPAGEGWLHEIKFDGYRAIARFDGGSVTFASRNGKDWTGPFGSLAAEVARLPAK